MYSLLTFVGVKSQVAPLALDARSCLISARLKATIPSFKLSIRDPVPGHRSSRSPCCRWLRDLYILAGNYEKTVDFIMHNIYNVYRIVGKQVNAYLTQKNRRTPGVRQLVNGARRHFLFGANGETNRIHLLTSKDIEDENDDEDDWGAIEKGHALSSLQREGILCIHSFGVLLC
jgi:hypothetical protein